MTYRCHRCHTALKPHFKGGKYHFQHCGRSWTVPVPSVGKPRSDSKGTAGGAAIGFLGALGTAINPLGAAFVGALVGSAFNGDNHIKCHKCGHAAYPTGRHGRRGDRQYQCSRERCREFTYARAK